MGEFLSQPNKAKVSYDNENSNIRFGVSEMQGWRKKMEDTNITALNLGSSKSLDIFAVFDGHGGKEIAQFVKEHFIEEFLNSKAYLAGNIKQGLIETFLRMDELLQLNESKEELQQLAKISKAEEETNSNAFQSNQFDQIRHFINAKDEECEIAMMAGCTACVCVIDHSSKTIYFANAGDSRAVLCKNKQAKATTIDHKPELETEKNRIYKAEGWINEGRIMGNLNMSRSLGDLEYKQNKNLKAEEQMIAAYPEVTEESLTADCDFIIIGCDGIWDCLSNQEACDYVASRLEEEKPLSKIIEEMMDSILAEDIYNETGVGCDNMTSIAIQFKKKP